MSVCRWKVYRLSDFSLDACDNGGLRCATAVCVCVCRFEFYAIARARVSRRDASSVWLLPSAEEIAPRGRSFYLAGGLVRGLWLRGGGKSVGGCCGILLLLYDLYVV